MDLILRAASYQQSWISTIELCMLGLQQHSGPGSCQSKQSSHWPSAFVSLSWKELQMPPSVLVASFCCLLVQFG